MGSTPRLTQQGRQRLQMEASALARKVFEDPHIAEVLLQADACARVLADARKYLYSGRPRIILPAGDRSSADRGR